MLAALPPDVNVNINARINYNYEETMKDRKIFPVFLDS
jgi:hypothetical protein